MMEVVVERPEIEKIKNIREKDKEVVKLIEEMRTVRELRGDEQEIEGELVLKKGKIYMPKDKKLRLEVIWLHYDIPVAGYRDR